MISFVHILIGFAMFSFGGIFGAITISLLIMSKKEKFIEEKKKEDNCDI